MTRTLLIPGIDGSPDPHWQAWWQKNDPMALTVHQDDWANPSPEAWEAEVAGAVLQHPGAILVAHSLGLGICHSERRSCANPSADRT